MSLKLIPECLICPNLILLVCELETHTGIFDVFFYYWMCLVCEFDNHGIMLDLV